jgi:hypothetical protein
MSASDAAATCWRMVGWFAFQPKRPNAVRSLMSSRT